MSLTTFHKALKLCQDYDLDPFLGGGEPTLHPQFERMLLDAIVTASTTGGEQAGIITNGSHIRRSMMIVKLRKAGVIWAALSQDQYHDPISQKVIDAFAESGETYQDGNTAFHNTTRNGQRKPLPHGRALTLLGYDEDDSPARDEGDCPCEGWLIQPDGHIRQCGCDDAPIIGHVNDTTIEPLLPHDCHLSREFQDYLCD